MKKKSSIFLAGLCCAAVLTGCGNVSQATKTIELGESVTVMDLVDCKDGVSASIKNKSALDTMKVGSYDVTFTVKTGDGKTEEKTFTYEVVDTTAPEIATGDKLSVIKGVDFNIQELVAATDLSGDVTITSSVNVDTKTPGEYPITVTATDTSGNKATKDIVVTVLERTETNFRNAVWGDDQNMIESLETAKKSYDEGNGFFGYDDVIATIPVQVYYDVDPKYGLHFGAYAVDKDYSWNGASAISDYYTLKEQLVKKYGEPDSMREPGTLSWMAEYSQDAGEALFMGYIFYSAEWDIPEKNTEIFIEAGRDDYGILTRIVYKDTRYKADYSGSF